MTTVRLRRTNTNPTTESSGNSVSTGYESDLWRMADTLRGSMDAAEYKHVVLGLVFLKYISDAFEEAYAKLEAERTRALIQRIPMNTEPRASSGCRLRLGGQSYKLRPASPPLAAWWTML